MKTQSVLLEELAWRRRPREVVLEELQAFGIVLDGDLYTLPVAAVLEVIDSRLAGQLTEEEIVDWALYFECREEVGYEESARDAISEAIFLLANPEINYPLTRENLLMIKSKLELPEKQPNKSQTTAKTRPASAIPPAPLSGL